MPMMPREMISLLQKNGFEIISQNGSHVKLRNENTGKTVIVPYHNKALKKGLEFTDYHQDFQNKAVRYGVVLTPTGKISKKSNLTPAQLKELERTSKVAGRFQKKYGSSENAKKVINVQKFLNTSVEFIYEKIKNAETEEEFELAQKFDSMLEDGLTKYDYDEIYGVLNKLGAFDTDYEYNPFLDKYPSREERKNMTFKGRRGNI